MKLLLSFFIFIWCQMNFAAVDYYGYHEATQVPEPMFYDLVRGLHSKKGEFEANTLFYQQASNELRSLHAAPEIEWVPADNWGVELELPSSHGKVEALKLALQHGFDRSQRSFVDGLQLILERNLEHHHTEGKLTYLMGKRFPRRWSAFAIVGLAIEGPAQQVKEVTNLSVFYDVLRRVDFGAELNLVTRGGSSEFLQFLPQAHLALDEKMKVQLGTGVQYLAQRWYSTGALRLIREWNL